MKNNLFKYLMLVSVLLIACTQDEPYNFTFSDFEPINLDDGLTVSTVQAVSMDEPTMTQIYSDLYRDQNLWSMRSFLVFRHGDLVAESYMADQKYRTEPQLIWSCTKQVLGILVGIAVEEGLIESIDDPISNYFDTELSDHEDKADILIRDLITMRSGIDYDNDGVGGETDKLLREIPDDMIEFILSRPMVNEARSHFHYNDGDPHLMSAIIQKQAGKATDEWADEAFFSKIDMQNYNWVRYKDGQTYGGYGLASTPREMGKIGLCVLNDGMWKGDQVIPSNWLQEMMDVTTAETGIDFSFGYYWWLDQERGMQIMWGHGGQFVFVIPAQELVIVSTAIPNTQGKYQILANEILPYVDRIVDACD